MSRRQVLQFIPLATGEYQFSADDIETDDCEPSTPSHICTVIKKYDNVEEVLAQIEIWRNQITLSQVRKCCGDLLAYLEEKG